MNNYDITPRQLERCTRLYKVVFPLVLEKEALHDGSVNLSRYGSDCNTPLCILGYAAMDNVFVAEGLHMRQFLDTKDIIVKFGRKLLVSSFFSSHVIHNLNLFDTFCSFGFETQRDDILDRQRRLKEFLIENGVEL